MNDDFNGTTINTTLWNVVISPPGVGTITETNQRLEMVKTGMGTSFQGLESRCKAGGDFDVQVDFTLLNWPVPNYHVVRLVSLDMQPGPVGLVGLYRASYFTEIYQMRSITGVAGEVAVPDVSGKLRLVRTGSTIGSYYWDGTKFVLVASSPADTVDTRFALIFDFDTGPPPSSSLTNIAVALDNFKVNAGTITCPP
jgi:hypothetical protein